jgi:hypothetical protein
LVTKSSPDLQYYIDNSLRANPAKTQACAFHLRNKEAKHTLNIKWNGQNIEHCSHTVYLGVTLDRTLYYKQHVEKTRSKVNTRVNILNKLAGTTWGAYAKTLKATAQKMDAALNH